MKQSDLNLIANNADSIKRNVLAAKSRARPKTGTVAARQRELISTAILTAQAMLVRLESL